MRYGNAAILTGARLTLLVVTPYTSPAGRPHAAGVPGHPPVKLPTRRLQAGPDVSAVRIEHARRSAEPGQAGH